MSCSDNLPYRPKFCVWELTLACNLRCGHCGSSAGRRRPDELNTEEAVDVVHQLADLECQLITLSGGEPTLRSDWEVIARAAVERGVTVNMVTNGTTVTPGLAARIAKAGLANVGISLDGTPEVHDSIRGPGTFVKVARAMRVLADAGVSTSMLTHLNRDTVAELDAIHDLALELGSAAWRVQLGKPMGNLADRSEMVIRPRDLLNVIPRLARIKKRSPLWVYVGDSIGYYGPHERDLRETRWRNMRPWWSGCQAGQMGVGIESDGGVKGCLSLQAGLSGCGGCDPFREGDLRTRRLADIWFDPEAFAYNRKHKHESLTGACARCRYARLCRGGAKCVASAFTGGLGEDPYCYYRVAREESFRRRFASSLGRRAAAAVMSVGLGLGGACLGGATLSGCLDRAVGHSDNEPDAVLVESDASVPEDAALEPDADPPVSWDYGVFPLLDASVEEDGEPPNHMDYGYFPPYDATIQPIEPDAEPPNTPDYGDIPPQF
jgi:radical SAM protein with 4Fe4S-binding SPASM domain